METKRVIPMAANTAAELSVHAEREGTASNQHRATVARPERVTWYRLATNRDLLIVAVLTVGAYVLFSKFEFNEELVSLTRSFESYQLDELPAVLLVLALALTWFSWRRWKEAGLELSRRLAVEAELEKSEQQYRLLFMENFAGNLLASPNGVLRFCNPAMARILGLGSPESAVGTSLGTFYLDRELWSAHCRQLQDGKKVELDELHLVAANGAPVTVMARMMANFTQGEVSELHVFLTDITGLKLMEGDLADALSQNRLLSRRQILLLEDERKSMARELHDELGQYLNAIKLDAVFIRDRTRTTLPDLHSSAQSIVEISSQVYDVVRGIMRRLRPVALDELGLVTALECLVDSWRERFPEIDFSVTVAGNVDGLAEQLNITIYRLVQEALTNIAKHAKASSVRIAITKSFDGSDADTVTVLVRDDGAGMDLHSRRPGLGILGMRERVDALGGRLEIESHAGKGFCLSATIPLGKG
jgi:signal transduction histidine kinase